MNAPHASRSAPVSAVAEQEGGTAAAPPVVPRPPEEAFSYAFQPIVDVVAGEVFAYEALVRGLRNEPASVVLGLARAGDIHRFDRESRAAAIVLAARLGIQSRLSINVLPRGLQPFDVDGLATLQLAREAGLSAEHLILEVTEEEVIDDHVAFAALINEYRCAGMQVAVDDFGAGYSGLNLLADFQPDLIKLDMHLVRAIESRGPRQSIARAIISVCTDLGIDVIAEGVETGDEYAWFLDEGVRLFQGYYLARPGFESLPAPARPDREPCRSAR